MDLAVGSYVGNVLGIPRSLMRRKDRRGLNDLSKYKLLSWSKTCRGREGSIEIRDHHLQVSWAEQGGHEGGLSFHLAIASGKL